VATQGIPADRLAAFDLALAEMADNLSAALDQLPRGQALRTVTVTEG